MEEPDRLLVEWRLGYKRIVYRAHKLASAMLDLLG